eukprot:CAMPEP_0197575300 /NCGR_PEP_ID=MMETSP1326-20131121/742_1 /TAXON_ID=1155430 /ORGANISM="Genus nov. species nov., Strain RCC2288" /LENGTH=199 /DNA_ID=CAMNT_0043138043 /DNA_START=37 /DNA_END=636 /DNA_ORIENTATION=-
MACVTSAVVPTAARVSAPRAAARRTAGVRAGFQVVAKKSAGGENAAAAVRFGARRSDSSSALRRAAPVTASARRGARVVAAAGEGGEAGEDKPVPFGYTRADVLIIGVGTTAAGFIMYYGLQANGVSAIWAGNIVQLTFVGGLTIAWVGSYVMRVFNKDMTYVKQLKDYEDAVMAKRLEELPEAELQKMLDDISKLDPK